MLRLKYKDWQRSWMKHYATRRKVAVLIPDEVFAFSIDLIIPAWDTLSLLQKYVQGNSCV
jgi:hypothetical protein